MDQNPAQQALQQNQGQQPQPPGITDILKQRVAQDNQTLDAQPENPSSAASNAMSILNPQGNLKDGEANKMSQFGQSIKTPAYAGYCLQYVDDQTGNSNRQPTAYADYQVKSQNGQISNSNNVPDGARVYFAPDASNGNMGHVGLANKNGTFTSATDNGVKTYSISDWEKYTGQKFIGWSK